MRRMLEGHVERVFLERLRATHLATSAILLTFLDYFGFALCTATEVFATPPTKYAKAGF